MRKASGQGYEGIIKEVFRVPGLRIAKQVDIGTTPAGRRHRVDYIVWAESNPGEKILISCKVQNVTGTAEEKIPYEVIKLLHALRSSAEYVGAYLVLGGMGWTEALVDWYRSNLKEFLRGAERIPILTTDELITLGMSGEMFPGDGTKHPLFEMNRQTVMRFC